MKTFVRFPSLARTGLLAFSLSFAAPSVPIFAKSAAAMLSLDKIEVSLLAENRSRDDVAVTNASDTDTAYVEVTVFEILNPGTAAEERVRRESPEEAGMLAAPRQLVLAPGQTRLVRLIALGPPMSTDRVYRVEIKPVAGDFVAEGLVVRVLVGYEVLVIARPRGGTPRIEAERRGRTLSLRNTGNSTGVLGRGKVCDASETNCADLPSRRMYPGNEMTVELPYDGPVTYRLGVGLDWQSLQF